MGKGKIAPAWSGVGLRQIVVTVAIGAGAVLAAYSYFTLFG